MNFIETYTLAETQMFINWIDSTAQKAQYKGKKELVEICQATKEQLVPLRNKLAEGSELSSDDVQTIRINMKHWTRLMPDKILTEA